MIDITITDKEGKNMGSCGVGLNNKEIAVFRALRNALADYPKLLEVFGD